MKAFISKKIGEKDLLLKTPLKEKYEALYLCSVLVLPEERGKGLARRLLIRSITAIQKKHPIKAFFFWGFSKEGKRLAAVLGKEFALPVYSRKA
jgi:GNAT superfamily N-acetyltransferase